MPTEYVIHKHILKAVAVQDIEMVEGSKILDIQIQQPMGNVVLWEWHEAGKRTTSRRIEMKMTGGASFPHPGDYIKTIQQGGFVAHFFDGGEHDPSRA